MNRYQKLNRALFYHKHVSPIFTIVFAAVLALAAYPAWCVWAAGGNLDTSFSGDGKWSDDSYLGKTEIADIRIQIDPNNPTVEKIIVPLTDTSAYIDTIVSPPSFKIKRLYPSGVIDSSFGISGTAVTDFSDIFPFPDWGAEITALEQQADGKILVAGIMHHKHSDQSLVVLARLNFDGALDPTFGNSGRWFFFGHAEVADMTLQSSNGKIVLAGRWKQSAAASWKSALWRLHPTGVLDTSFSGDGFFDTTVVAGNAEDGFGFKSAYVQSDGKIVAMNSHFAYRLRRVTSSGNLDSTLNVNATTGERGRTIRAVGSNIWIVGAKETQGTNYGAIFARISTNGLTDTSFGSNGQAVSSQPSFWTVAALMPFSFPAKYVIVGSNYYPPIPGNPLVYGKAVITRYGSTGVLDTSFGTNGSTETVGFDSIEGSHYTTVRCGLSGKIVAAGLAGTIPGITIGAIAKYWNN